MKTVKKVLSKNAVALIAFFLACATSLLVPFSRDYLSYIDFKTIACLFCMLAVVCALKNVRFFTYLARKIVQSAKNVRTMSAAVVFITYIGSMLIANDMALITFLPLGYFSLKLTNSEKYTAYVFILQNTAANLGGMLTPFGNPQNLYLYSKFNIPTGVFMKTMAPPFCAAAALMVLCLLLIKPEKIEISYERELSLPPFKTAAYIALFLLSVLMVFRVVPYLWGLCAVLLSVLVLDGKALLKVDYGLLFTFFFFFIFAGNMSNLEGVRRVLSSLLSKDTLLFSTLSCQFISTVPSAVLLSRFTENGRELLWGVNIGGGGTLISSLASLITFREYSLHNGGKVKRYLLLFSAVSFGFLIVLTSFLMIIR